MWPPCRDGRFGSKVGQIGPKWDKSRAFLDQISVHLARGPFGANLTEFEAKPSIPGVMSCPAMPWEKPTYSWFKHTFVSVPEIYCWWSQGSGPWHCFIIFIDDPPVVLTVVRQAVNSPPQGLLMITTLQARTIDIIGQITEHTESE